MDIKLFTEFLLKRKVIYQKTWLLWKTHFPLADTSSFWSLSSDRQMDIKLFTEFLLKRKMIHQKTWLLWKTHFPLLVKVKSLKAF